MSQPDATEENPFAAYARLRKAEDELAMELGWTKRTGTTMAAYVKGDIHVWQMREGWQCADLGPSKDPKFPHAKCYWNHRPYGDLETALRIEGAK